MNTPARFLTGLCAATALFLGQALAAEAPSARSGVIRPGPPPLERFIEPLALTAAQQQKLRPVFAAAQAQAEADLDTVRADNAEPADEQVMAMVRMREADFRERLAGILTPEQLTKYNHMTADTTPREEKTEQHSAHGHRDADTPATARDR
jgi:hypothetical protein